MVVLYSKKVNEIAIKAIDDESLAGLSYLNKKGQSFLAYLLKNKINSYSPLSIANKLNVTNRTVINWSGSLSKNGFIIPQIAKERVLSYSLLELSIDRKRTILKMLASD